MSDLSDRIGAILSKQEAEKREHDEALAANQAKIKPFIEGTVLPAFQELKEAFEKHGRTADVYIRDTSAMIEVSELAEGNALELRYVVEPHASTRGFSVTVKVSRGTGLVGDTILGGRSPIELDEISKQTVIDDVFRNWQHR